MIYLDNAATTRQKPPCVIQAVTEALQFMGNAGRGGHDASLGTSRIIFQTRDKLAELARHRIASHLRQMQRKH